MSNVTANLKAMDLDQVCREVEDLADRLSMPDAPMSHLLLELARRARVMDQHLSPKPEDAKMPEPVQVWLWRGQGGKWNIFTNPVAPYGLTGDGPHTIIPGIMTPDELAKHELYIFSNGDGWFVEIIHKIEHRTLHKLMSKPLGTALEAQWAATQLAKKGGG